MKEPDFSQEQREFIRSFLKIPCCHVSGMHEPEHFVDNLYVCGNQAVEIVVK